MNDLVEFYRARLDERAAKAQAAMRSGEGRWTQADPERHPGMIEDERCETVVYDEGSPTEEQAAHIAENDPARVLREVERDRRIIEEHPILTAWRVCTRCSDFHDGEPVGKVPGPCMTLRLLALAEADHPDYDEGWRP